MRRPANRPVSGEQQQQWRRRTISMRELCPGSVAFLLLLTALAAAYAARDGGTSSPLRVAELLTGNVELRRNHG